MKAIQQLISYFDERGRLTRRQIEELVSRGYWAQYTSADLRSLEQKVGQSFCIQTTGNAHGPLWGTDVYTSDSDLGTACVHAGLLRRGEPGVIKVTIVAPLSVFPGSTRNGVTSSLWTNGWPGAFEVELFKKPHA
jgi:LCCL domain